MYGVNSYASLKPAPFFKASWVAAETVADLVCRLEVVSLPLRSTLRLSFSCVTGMLFVYPIPVCESSLKTLVDCTLLLSDCEPAHEMVSVSDELSVNSVRGVLSESVRLLPLEKSCCWFPGYER